MYLTFNLVWSTSIIKNLLHFLNNTLPKIIYFLNSYIFSYFIGVYFNSVYFSTYCLIIIWISNFFNFCCYIFNATMKYFILFYLITVFVFYLPIFRLILIQFICIDCIFINFFRNALYFIKVLVLGKTTHLILVSVEFSLVYKN